MKLSAMNKAELTAFRDDAEKMYEQFKALGLKLDMSRGKPSPEQLDLSVSLFTSVDEDGYKTENGFDCRNYGLPDGIPEAKRLFASMIGVDVNEIIIGGNSSLNLMFMCVQTAYTHGILGGTPWGKLDKVKFLCPVPGYDRHFTICEFFGIEMINVPMLEDGPDMDMIEKFVAEDEAVKGIFCVPQYSNPQGINYSDEVVRRFAALKPKAADFRIFWDNAYAIHYICDEPKFILPLLQECKKAGNDDIAYIFGSTSKITFAGAGVALIGSSEANINGIKKMLAVCTINFDKINQLRHAKFFKTYENMVEHMKHHKELLIPRFNAVVNMLEKEIAPYGIGSWHKPDGGYFVSFDAMDGCAKRIAKLCRDAGVVLTDAGATFPYGNDPRDRNLRIAPTFPSVEELTKAMELFTICVKLASAEKILIG